MVPSYHHKTHEYWAAMSRAAIPFLNEQNQTSGQSGHMLILQRNIAVWVYLKMVTLEPASDSEMRGLRFFFQ